MTVEVLFFKERTNRAPMQFFRVRSGCVYLQAALRPLLGERIPYDPLPGPFSTSKTHNIRHISSFITTPIFYVNSSPHIGHLYSALIGDVVHRWRKLKGYANDDVIFSTGTDEHGMKIYKAAAAAGKEPKIFCDEVSSRFKNLFGRGQIDYTHYVRTTDEKHQEAVATLWNTLQEKGHIYKGEYNGWYCIADEEYLTDAEVKDDESVNCKVSIHSGHPVEWYTEENYMFRLTDFRSQLLQWVNSAPYPVVPMFAKERVSSWLESDNFTDLSISRPSDRLPWGIPVPGDATQTVYVWLDALVNYLTVSGYPSPNHHWPPTEHIIGHDILRFHAIYWPAFLMAADLDLPRKIVTHSHWMCNGYKMSKSRGNVVDPMEQFDMFGVDEVRYFMLKRGILQYDGEYSMESLVNEVNADLANSLGNVIGRISSHKLIVDKTEPAMQFSSDLFPFCGEEATSSSVATDQDLYLINSLHELPGIVHESYESLKIRNAIKAISACLDKTDKFISRWEPWCMVKDPSSHALLDSVLLVAMESLRLCSSLLTPVIPRQAAIALNRLGFPRQPHPGQLTSLLTKEGVHNLESSSVGMRRHRHNQQQRPVFTRLAMFHSVDKSRRKSQPLHKVQQKQF